MGLKFWAGLVGCAVLCGGAMGAMAQAGNDLAFARAQRLQHGINASMWFAQAPGRYQPERLRSFTTADDFRLMHRLGFDHIRLSLDATPLVAWQQGRADGTAYMRELDRVLAEALHEHLNVILDVHPETSYKKTLLAGDESAAGFAAMWKAMAQHFVTQDPEHVFFEIMNEPEQTDAARWREVEGGALTAIRSAAPQFTVIVSAIHWDGLQDMMAMQTFDDANLLYSFHDYDPMMFTHQGATWAGDVLKPLRNVPYPSTPENVAANVAQEPTLLAQMQVSRYGLDRWDAQRLDTEISYAEKWGAEHHVPVYCGEFGVHRPYAPTADRARWVHDMRTALEHHHIGWAMWDYQTNFGVVSKQNGKTTVDEGLVEALGLHPAH